MDMPEIKSWDTVFFVRAINQNIGIRVYYEEDPRECSIRYTGQTKEFGVEALSYNDNPTKGVTTTYTYKFSVVAGQPYSTEKDGKKFTCMEIRVEAMQNAEVKNSTMHSVTSEFLDDGKSHQTTVCMEC